MIELYVNNKKADIDSKTSANITYAMSDVNNPATIKSDYTKSIELPLTDNNKKIFGYLNRLDSTSALYNASKRYDCELRYNGDVVIKGYVKLEEITDSISITIFGQVGEFFKTLEDKKIISIANKFPDLSHTLDREFIKANWRHENSVDGTNINDFVAYGFGYTGLYDDFNSSSVQVSTSGKNSGLKDEEVEDIIFTDNPEDVDEHQMKLYMSYGQRRGFYVNKLFKAILDDSGYKFDLSPEFFNSNNPYWKDTVVFFNKEKTIERESIGFYSKPVEAVIPQNTATGTTPITIINDIPFDRGLNAKYLDSNGYLDFDKVDVAFSHLNATVDVDFIFDQFTTSGRFKAVTDTIFTNLVTFYFKNLNYLDPVPPGYVDTAYFTSDFVPDLKWEFNAGMWTEIKESNILKGVIINKDVKPGDVLTINNILFAKMPYIGKKGPVRLTAEFTRLTRNLMVTLGCRIRCRVNSVTVDLIDDISYRSGVLMNAQQILSNNTSQKDFILSYLKMFDLHVVVDKFYKRGKILTRNEFYKDYKVDDWDNFLDSSKESTIVPVTFDTKYISFKYKDGKTNFDKSYKDVWDRVYGEARIDTGYEFKEDPLDSIKSLFSTPVIAQDKSWEFTNRYRRGSTRDDKLMMYSCDKKGNVRERVDNGMQIYFRNGLKPCVEYQITDDTKDMIKFDKYCHNWTFKDGQTGEAWTDGVNELVSGKKQFYYRQFSSISNDGRCSLDFRRPAEIFFEGSYPDNICIYDLFWSKYVEDGYNVDNKLFTGYFKLPKSYLMSFTFDRFIYLKGQYWKVLRVVDFDPSKDENVLVELVQIKNINNYVKSQNFPWLNKIRMQ